MELEKCGDGDHSTEIQSALKRFEDVCNSLEDEHTKLIELEKRRQKLNDDLERLRNEIKEEKNYFRSVIDEQCGEELQDVKHACSVEQLGEVVEPATLDTGAIKEYIQNQRDELASRDQDIELDRFNENRYMYEIPDPNEEFEEYEQQSEEVTEELIRQHLDDIDTQRNLEELDILEEVCNDMDVENLSNPTGSSRGDLVEYLTSDDD